MIEHNCPSCGKSFVDPICPWCGENVPGGAGRDLKKALAGAEAANLRLSRQVEGLSRVLGRIIRGGEADKEKLLRLIRETDPEGRLDDGEVPPCLS